MALPEIVSRAIREKYAPRTKEGAIREDVLFVGSLLDGLVVYLPDVLQVAFNTPTPQADGRRYWKALLNDSQAGEGRAHTMTASGFTLVMEREEWKKAATKRAPTAIALTSRVVDEEPGALINSYLIQQDPETGDWKVWEKPKGERPPTKEFDPRIRENKPFNLHYLLRGDRFTADFTRRGGQKVTMRFALRHPSEGSSLLTPEQAVGVGRW